MKRENPILVRLARAPLEWLLTSVLAFGLVTATPLQRAICRVMDGAPLGELATHPDVVEAIGELPPEGILARTLLLLAGVRGAKSLFAAAAAVRCSQRVVLPDWLKAGEVPRVSIVSLDKDKADVVFNDHLVSTIQNSPALRPLLIGEPKAGSLFLRHPSGRPIEVSVRAGKRAGGDLVSRWSAGAIFDEATRMSGAEDGVINLDDGIKAVASRLLPGAMMLLLGSPWAPYGPAFKLYNEHHKHPTESLVVVKGRGQQMNPSWWTDERVAELRATNPDVATTDVDAEFLSHEESLFAAALLLRCTRAANENEGDLPYNRDQSYWAAMDPGMRGNAWTLVIATRVGRKRVIACVRQWIGSRSEPLSPRAVMKEIASVLREYGLDAVESDQYYIDTLIEIGRDVHLDPTHEKPEGANAYPIRVFQHELSEREKSQEYLDIRTKFAEDEIELHPDSAFQEDLRRVRRRATQTGIAIVLPNTKDGRHCDYAPPMMLVCARNLDDVKEPRPRSTVGEDPETKRTREMYLARMRGGLRRAS